MGYTCIVCGVTGSPHAQKAALEAASLAKKDTAKLVYVYAVDASFVGKSLMAEVSQTYVEDALAKLGKTLLDHAEEMIAPMGISPKKIVKKGKALQVLKQVILDEKGDLLVIGHEERTRVERTLLGGEVETHAEELKKVTGAEVMIVR